MPARAREVDTAVRAAAEALRLDELDELALPALARAVGASGILLFRFDERGVPRGVAGSLAPTLTSYGQELFAEDPVQRALLRLEEQPPHLSFEELRVARRDYHRSAAYTDYYRPHDIEHLLARWISGRRYGTPGMAGVLATRGARQADFAALESGLLLQAGDALAAAVRRHDRLADREALEAAMLGDSPRLGFAPDGRMVWRTPAAARLLERRGGGAQPLPGELIDDVRRLGALAEGRPGERPRHQRDLVLADGRPLRAELMIARKPSGAPVVRVDLQFAGLGPDDLAGFAARHRLTRAEATVLNQLALAPSNAEIAARLHVSIETVRTHVQRILSKLAVATREDAAARLRAAAP